MRGERAILTPEAGPAARAADVEPLHIELEGWKVLLDLLVDQYLGFVERAGALRLELAADYLVMAAWLRCLKSAPLLPREEQPGPGPEEFAAQLHLRLQRLGTMRDAAARPITCDRVGRWPLMLRAVPA